jgi:hypothetical protein
MMGISKTRSLFPGEKKPAQIFRLSSPLKREEPCPLKPSNGFLNTHHSLLIFYHKILDANHNYLHEKYDVKQYWECLAFTQLLSCSIFKTANRKDNL